jgi:hypothetical protein
VLTVVIGGQDSLSGRGQVGMAETGQGEQRVQPADLGEQDRDVGGRGPQRGQAVCRLGVVLVGADGVKIDQ